VQFSRASSRLRQLIDLLPEHTEEDELLLEDGAGPDSSIHAEGESSKEIGANDSLLKVDSTREEKSESVENFAESDPFGLNALMPRPSKKEERARRKKEEAARKKDEEAADLQAQKEASRLLRERREACIASLTIASERYKLPW
jgi:hypothetical protein